ncbi:transporter substrate-binding domain-containing protein [Mesorhizobium sp.]|uniref:transporter substrate-binding domain-containing protein n=1 Tax=Mesorhizobium sp. TaxID=1871066 RepID=UPI000FE64CA9|nr:transporter substrate-binding domain-containing protein [Mesorhizobium sp.]RWI99735.1 MAG: transporter substrate-binding domain-containing protein [Mesorhizobium sp.]RWL96845.1 MAG: transporter substrate-binding domain-containing protein [Mesorhizobium sp.]RWO93057.1 MAG: transporter substrate-binding domain-containing protein [Mesorhizobium sp.]
MYKITKTITAASIAIASVAFCTSAYAGEVLQRVLDTKTLKVAVGTDWGTISSLNTNHELEGYDIDVAKGVAKYLGVKAEFVTPGWDLIVAGHWVGRWDIGMGQMTPTTERAEKLDFSENYYYGHVVAIVHTDSKAKEIADLNGEIVGVTTGTLEEQYANQTLTPNWIGARPIEFKFKAGQVKAYSSANVAFDDLRLGDGIRLNAVITDRESAARAIKSGYPLRVLGTLFSAPGAISMMKGDKEFQDKISAAIKSMKDDGTLSKISIKWYGTDNSVEK